MQKVTICIPSYNNEQTILHTVQSALMQDGVDEILISDDASTDKTVEKIKEFKDERIRLIENSYNVGCGGNLNRIVGFAKDGILIFLCGDDMIIDPFATLRIRLAFRKGVAIVTRPYLWVDRGNVVRSTGITFSPDKFKVFQSFDQISGIAIDKKYIDTQFSNKPFVEMGSVCWKIFTNHKVIMSISYSIAVRVHAMKKEVFKTSPLLAWYEVVKDDKQMVDYIAKNYIGLVQIKTHGTMKYLIREVWHMIRLRPKNLLNPVFWFFALGTILTPQWALRKMVERYRRIPK